MTSGGMVERSRDSGVIGRETELASVQTFLSAEEAVAAFVVTGDPGIGKTMIWEAGVDHARASGFRVLLTRASEPEVQLDFVGLADLLEDVDLAGVSSVPAPQQRALEVALLRTEPGPPDPLTVAAGLTAVLRLLADEAPLVVAIDDVPWLDAGSARALSFAARRVAGRRIRFLLARRLGEPPPLERAFRADTVELLTVGPLTFGATRSLLIERLDLTLPRRVLRRVHETTAGNALFALEVGRLLRDRGMLEIGAEIPIPNFVDELFAKRIGRLAGPTRRALLAVALDAGVTRRQLASIVDPLALEDAISADLVVLDGERVRVSHPLLAAAARRHSRGHERRELHLALAAAAGDNTLRAQHLALAATGVDGELASTVAAAGASAIARGAAHDAIELAEQALRLTPPDTDARAERVLDLARYLVIAGERGRARELLQSSIDDLAPGPLRGRAYLQLGECAETVDEWDRFLRLALGESAGSPELHATVLATQVTVLTAVRFCELDRAEALAHEAIDKARSAGSPEHERWAFCALAWVYLLRGRPVADLRGDFQSAPQGSSLYESSIERVLGTQMVTRGELIDAQALFADLLREAEERGEAGSGQTMHGGLCEVALRAGDVGEVIRLFEEAHEWWALEDVDWFRGPRMAIVEALRGNPDEAERWAAETIAHNQAVGTRREELEGLRARGIAALLRHQPEQAAEALRPIWQHMCDEAIEDPGVWPMAPDLVEALVDAGALDEADGVTARLQRISDEQAHPWGLASAKRCRALVGLATDVADSGPAASLAEAALAYGELGLRFDQARSLLSLGRAQRRARKWADARRALTEATTLFDELGCRGWADGARAELERVGARRPAPQGELTPAEARVARMAAQGHSNKEIAAALFVSVNTVERHLSHAYAKLGVRSRAQLAQQLPAG